MKSKEILTQEEIDALLSTVEDNGARPDQHATRENSNVKLFDFTNQNALINTGIPSLNVAHERFALGFSDSIANDIRSSNSVEFTGTRVVSFVDYLNSLEKPSYINLINLSPMKGMALAVIDKNLVGLVVDLFYGGGTSTADTKAKRDFTPAEGRIGDLLIRNAFSNLRKAWQSIIPLNPELVRVESNPDFAHVLNPSEPLMLASFAVSFEAGSGLFQLAIPHVMIEPIYEQLAALPQFDKQDIKGTWASVLMEEIKGAYVEVSSELGYAELSFKDILKLKPGDVIPLDVAEELTLFAEGVPILKGTFGASNGKNSLKITGKARRQNA